MRCLNSSGERKKYSTPWRSVPRGALLVHDMENARCSSLCCISQLMMVLLPDPEGAENMITFPFFMWFIKR